ncbi:ABC transporter permease [Halomicrococcus gelatinilyticus]|uniref:ABC transporter permease n=1 Tax=Halomicrococcus gelatinilyticus TaxID=1702103 RepID=UPI002E12D1A2
MPLNAVVEKEFLDSVRSSSLLGLTALFVLFAGFLAAIQWVPNLTDTDSASTSTLALLNSMKQPTVVFVPMIALGIGYDVIAGERENGSLKLMLGLPNSRRDVVFGKFLGRTAVVGVAILVSYVTVGIIALLTYDSFDATMFGLYTLLTICYGAVYIAISIGVSAGTRSRARALGGVVAIYSLIMLLWDALLYGLQLVVYGPEPPAGGLPAWVQLVGLLNPSTAFMFAARAVIPEYYELTVYPESDAFYLQDWVGFVVLGLWAVVPLALGYWRFETTDYTG